MNIIWLFQVKSLSLINVFFYLSVHKLVALLFNFRTSCKLQPKYDIASGDSSIGYFCGRQLLSQQHQPCSPKVHTSIQMFTEYLNTPSPWMCRLLKTLVWVWGNWGIFLNSNEVSRYTGHKKGAKKKWKKERKKCVYAYLHLLKLLSVSFMSR